MLRRVTIALLAIVLILTGAFVWLTQLDGVYDIGQALPLTAGFSVDLEEIRLPPGRCIVVRVTSDHCPYCEKDQSQYERVLLEAEQTNCWIVTVAPRVGDMTMASAKGTVSLQYVDLAVGRALMPFRTPQTLIVDASHRLVWQRQGALNDDDLDAALQALGRLR